MFLKITFIMGQSIISVEQLEELSKTLLDIQVYDIKGFYNFHGKENHFTGLFKIGSTRLSVNKKIIGEIHDPNSVCPKHVVRGEVSIL